VIGVRGEQGEEGLLAHRHVQLIGGDYVPTGVSEFPPELVADHRHLQRVLRLLDPLDAEDGARRGQEQHHDDDHRGDRPGELHLLAAVDLGRLPAVVVLFFLNFTTE